MNFSIKRTLVFWIAVLLFSGAKLSQAQKHVKKEALEAIKAEIPELMSNGDIPGMSVILIAGNEEYIWSFGYADVDQQRPVTPQTLFEIGSCSKAFTALGFTRLEQEGLLDLDDPVSKYLPWWEVSFEDSVVEVTLKQLLYHTSGIPWHTISKIPKAENIEGSALETTIRTLMGQELNELPGERYEYATIGYDVLALVMEKVTGQSFESYMQEILEELPFHSTTIGVPKDSTRMARGYRIGFLRPRAYEAPRYPGNNAAGYIISNAEDMALWLKFQMGLLASDLSPLLPLTHQRDETVPLHNMSAYARGWNISLNGKGGIYHAGANPNFTAHVTFRPQQQLGVIVLANSNSTHTSVIGTRVLRMLAGEEIEREFDPGDGNDQFYTGISVVLIIYNLLLVAFLVLVAVRVKNKKRSYERIGSASVVRLLKSILLLLPFVMAVYMLPEAMVHFSWDAIIVWSPGSLQMLLALLPVTVGFTLLVYAVSLIFPESDKYRKSAPQILLVSILSGLSNVLIIVMVTSVIDSDIKLHYLIMYYLLIIAMYLLGRRYVQINLIKLTRGLVYDLRIQLVDKIFSTSYQRFEKIARGRIYTALNDDVNTIGQSTNLFVTLVTSIITAVGAFVYLASIAFWATMLTILLVLTLSTIYYLAVQQTNPYFEAARDSRNAFMTLVNGMIDGFKEISLQRHKKMAYKGDVAESANVFREKTSTADIRFVNAFLIGESLLVMLLGMVSIGMLEVFPKIEYHTIMSFVIILLYLIGPINSILGSVPNLMNLRIAWNRVTAFTDEIPANLNLDQLPKPSFSGIHRLEVRDVEYTFDPEPGAREGFKVGPVNLTVEAGRILFIVGGNGSGKTTLAKLLLGLYKPDNGEVVIDGKSLKNYELSEYFSAVFAPPHLFEKLYLNEDKERPDEYIPDYLKKLDLTEKVSVINDRYTTLKLSGGQRKRLALLQCYMEDSPIYLFDEWAADQDPEYRRFFYRTLLPEMRRQGKIVIAITHDDHYFDVADCILKMNSGKPELYTENPALATS